MLSGKKICLVGGSGFVGTAIAKRALELGAKVACVSRRGTPIERNPWQEKVEYVQGDASKPDTFSSHLENSDAVIHSVGTLIDTSITKGREPGEPGTYEFLNRDCAISIADKLNSYNSSC